ncbi:conserved hypothetical protein [Verticillium alfalfae VaMs.102]|uniref:MARVEL domain-containing protein n=1 Tax=Verticillium alfalfae (strain VaMs.102 / ATCC MYA-4576 / FGSC 10136) TaxID=526221 RepID=C9S6C8_VERA1|nr:conserved hypothetical protein [Verticillium alfalfae VaMs.102]EEY14440.1 conserved hypothetical protein [Verticillium alfalfae VaMs.102]
MALDRILSMVLRAAELAFAAIVTGLVGHYLDHSQASSWTNARHIYTIVVSAISILLALLWILPFSSAFVPRPVDLFMYILWFVAFAAREQGNFSPFASLRREMGDGTKRDEARHALDQRARPAAIGILYRDMV